MSKSQEWFRYYLQELKDRGLVVDFKEEPDGFNYAKGGKFNGHSVAERKYTPDFKVIWRDTGNKMVDDIHGSHKPVFIAQDCVSYFEVKSAKDVYNSASVFRIKQSVLWSVHGIYIQQVIPHNYNHIGNKKPGIFEITFIPVLAAMEIRPKGAFMLSDEYLKTI